MSPLSRRQMVGIAIGAPVATAVAMSASPAHAVWWPDRPRISLYVFQGRNPPSTRDYGAAPGATVRVINVRTGVAERTGTTDARGMVSFPTLTIGEVYSLQITWRGRTGYLCYRYGWTQTVPSVREGQFNRGMGAQDLHQVRAVVY